MPVKEELVEEEDEEEEMQVEEPRMEAERTRRIRIGRRESLKECQEWKNQNRLEENRRGLKRNEGMKQGIEKMHAKEEDKRMALVESIAVQERTIADQERKLESDKYELERTEVRLAKLQERYQKVQGQITLYEKLLYDEHTYEEEGLLYEQEEDGECRYW